MGNDLEKQLQKKLDMMAEKAAEAIEEEKDAWPGSPIEITVLEYKEGDPAEWLVEVPPAEYEEKVDDPYVWVEEVLSGETTESSELMEIDEAIKEDGFALQRAKQDVLDTARRLKRLETERLQLLEGSAWLPAVRKVLLPLADNLRAMIAKLDRRVTKVGLTANGRVTWAWDDGVDGEVPDQTGLMEEGFVDLSKAREVLYDALDMEKWLEKRKSE